MSNRLPAELIQHAYFLHVLATDPAKVIPPGKSLISMMARSQHTPVAETPEAVLHNRVEKVVHEAFWNEALESLSSPEPSVQLPRLKGLYSDLLDALSPLFPKSHPILQLLSSPLPPTSSPLHSTLTLLKEILTALRTRCAPVRDPEIDVLLESLADPPPSSINLETHTNALAALIIDTLKSLIALAGTLRADLTRTVLGAMSESQLAAGVAEEARGEERALVKSIWGGEDKLRAAWHNWVQDGNNDGEEKWKKWVGRLIQALGSPSPVSCDIPSPSHSTPPPLANNLPPQLFFTAPTLLYLQNYLQALVIAASLRSLVKLPAPNSSTELWSDFLPRIWALLKAEIDTDEYASGIHHTARDNAHGEWGATKIINLTDEVIRVQRLVTGPKAIDEAREDELRAAVERTLKPQDPVFLLLSARLMKAIGERVGEVLSESRRTGESRAGPDRMRTGRGNMRGVNIDAGGSAKLESMFGKSTVKGFEDPVLMSGIEDVLRNIIRCIEWVEGVWGDLI